MRQVKLKLLLVFTYDWLSFELTSGQSLLEVGSVDEARYHELAAIFDGLRLRLAFGVGCLDQDILARVNTPPVVFESEGSHRALKQVLFESPATIALGQEHIFGRRLVHSFLNDSSGR